MGGNVSVYIDSDGIVVLGTKHQFLPVVAEKIRHQTGISLGSVVGHSVFGSKHDTVNIIINDAGMLMTHIIDAVRYLSGEVGRKSD